jgi:hypothetical protein
VPVFEGEELPFTSWKADSKKALDEPRAFGRIIASAMAHVRNNYRSLD